MTALRTIETVNRIPSKRFDEEDLEYLGELHVRLLANRLKLSDDDVRIALVNLERLHLRSEETEDLVRRYVLLAPKFRKIQWRDAIRSLATTRQIGGERKAINESTDGRIEARVSELASLLEVEQNTLRLLLHDEVGSSTQLIRVDLPQLVRIWRSADELEQRSDKPSVQEQKERELKLTSQRLLSNVKSARGDENRRKFARAHDRLREKVIEEGLSSQLRIKIEENTQEIQRVLRISGSRGGFNSSALGPVIDALLTADLNSARELLGNLVAASHTPDEPHDLVSDMLGELAKDPSWAKSLTRDETQTWIDRAVAKHEQIQRSLSQWLREGQHWMEPAGWPRPQQIQAARFLLRGTIRWFDQENFRWRGSEPALSHLLVAADEILPFADLSFLSREPAAVNIGGTRVVNWFREGNVHSWVGFGEGAVALTIETRNFQVKRREPSDATLAAAMLAVAWLLDSISRSAGTRSTVLSDRGEDEWVTAQELEKGTSLGGMAMLEQHALHQVRAHIRTLPDGYRPTPEALERAPMFLRSAMERNQTYVRPSTRSSSSLFDQVKYFSVNRSFVSDVVHALKHPS